MRMRLGVVLSAFLWASTLRAAAPTPAPKPPANDDCLTCHEDPSATRADGSSVFVDKKVFDASVHGVAGASCVDCHTDLAKTTDFPHPEKLAKPDCSACHEQQVADYAKSFHAASRAKNPASKAAWCADCHGKHDIKPSSDPTSRTNHFNLPATCMRCHGDPKIFPRAGGTGGSEPVSFHDSIHGKALEQAGLKVAPNCATCHGYHEIRSPQDPKSTVVPRRTSRHLRLVPREDPRRVRGFDPRRAARERERERPRLLGLPYGPRDLGNVGRAAARDPQAVRRLPRLRAEVLPRHVPRPGLRARLRGRRDLLGLPHGPRDPAGGRPALVRRAREARSRPVRSATPARARSSRSTTRTRTRTTAGAAGSSGSRHCS